MSKTFTLNRRKGQSTVEYMVGLTAVIVIALFFLIGDTANPPQFQNQLNTAYSSGADGMICATQQFFDSLNTSN